MTIKITEFPKYFWSKVLKTESCWLWQAGCFRDRNGNKSYGQIRYKGKKWYAHRLAWFLTYGYDSKIHILHKCDVRNCVNPKHLFQGMAKDNAVDKVNKNRQTRGSKYNGSKLTENDVLKIRYDISNGISRKSLALKHNVSDTTIDNIVLRKKWKHI